MPDPHGATASIPGLDVVTERRVLLHQRRDEAETHLPDAPVDVFYEPNDRFVQVGDCSITITELSFIFQRGKREKTHVAARATTSGRREGATSRRPRARPSETPDTSGGDVDGEGGGDSDEDSEASVTRTRVRTRSMSASSLPHATLKQPHTTRKRKAAASPPRSTRSGRSGRGRGRGRQRARR